MSLGSVTIDLDGNLNPLRLKLSQGQSEATGWMGGLESMVKGATSTMFGTLAADLVRNVANLGSQFVVAGFNAAKQYQQTYFSLNTMVEQELMKGTKTAVVAGQVKQGLSKKEQQELDKLLAGMSKEVDQRDALALRIKKDTTPQVKSAQQLEAERLQRAQLTAQITKEQNDRAALAKKYGEGSTQVRAQDLAIQALQARLASVGVVKTQISALDKQIDQQQTIASQHRLQEANAEIVADQKRIAELTAKRDKMVPATKEVSVPGMPKEQAIEEAKQKTLDLMDWVQELAIWSPFNREDMAQSLKLGLVYGFSLEDAKKLTTGMVDFAAAAGLPGYEIEAMTRSLGQMNSVGKITERELRELARRGLPVYEMLSEITGTSMEDLKKVKELSGSTAKDVIGKLMLKIGERYQGKARQMTNTLPGLVTSFQDLGQINLSNLFAGRDGKGGIFGPLLDDMAKVVDFLNNKDFRTKVLAWGESIGLFIKTKVFPALQGLGAWITTNAVPAWQAFQRAVKPVTDGIATLLTIAGRLKTAFDLNGIQGVFDLAGAMFKNFDANAEMQKLVAGIANWMKTNSPISGEQRGKWAHDFWAWIWDPKGGAIAKIAETLTGLFVGLHTWLEGEDGQAQIRGIGRFIGEALLAAMGGTFGMVEPGGAVANLASALIQFLLDLAGMVGWIVVDIGTELGLALVRALYTALTGGEMSKEWQDKLRELPRVALGNLFNAEMWIEGARNMLKALLQAIEQVFGKAGENVKTAIENLIPNVNFTLSIPGRATGGLVSAQHPYVVGERGPELFVPRMSGSIVPHNAMQTASPGNTDNRRMENHITIVTNDEQRIRRVIGQMLSEAAWA